MKKPLSILRLAEGAHEDNKKQQLFHQKNPSVINPRGYDEKGHKEIKKAIKILENYEDVDVDIDDLEFGIPGESPKH